MLRWLDHMEVSVKTQETNVVSALIAIQFSLIQLKTADETPQMRPNVIVPFDD